MDWLQPFERAMGMDDAVWARHANPWSVLTRFTCLPLLILAVWSREWIGWGALIPVAAALAWIWWNPRAFPPPRRTDTWMSKGVLGERVYLNRSVVPIPAHHARAGGILSALAAPGAVATLYGLIVLDIWWTTAGAFWAMGFKTWFVDRMVWLYEDMKDAHPRYAAWGRPGGLRLDLGAQRL